MVKVNKTQQVVICCRIRLRFMKCVFVVEQNENYFNIVIVFSNKCMKFYYFDPIKLV